MRHRLLTHCALVLPMVVAGCDEATRVTSPTKPGAVVTSGPQRFVDAQTGFATTDLHDADGQVVQVSSTNELVWTATGTRLPGYYVQRISNGMAVQATLIAGKIEACTDPCWFEIRFGVSNGTPRAYLTIDYGHNNPGTLADLELVAGRLTVAQTTIFPPGTFTIAGRVTEATPNGDPLEGVSVSRMMTTGWQAATTDSAGLYELHGQWNGTSSWSVSKPGYQSQGGTVTVNGDTRVDVSLVRQ
jgi:hypothetical protein